MVDRPDRGRRRLTGQVLVVVGALEALAMLSAAVTGSVAWQDAALLAVMYAAPAVAVGWALGSTAAVVVAVARISAAFLALVYSAIVAGNWSGYDRRQAILVPLLTAPVVMVYLLAAFDLPVHRATT